MPKTQRHLETYNMLSHIYCKKVLISEGTERPLAIVSRGFDTV